MRRRNTWDVAWGCESWCFGREARGSCRWWSCVTSFQTPTSHGCVGRPWVVVVNHCATPTPVRHVANHQMPRIRRPPRIVVRFKQFIGSRDFGEGPGDSNSAPVAVEAGVNPLVGGGPVVEVLRALAVGARSRGPVRVLDLHAPDHDVVVEGDFPKLHRALAQVRLVDVPVKVLDESFRWVASWT